VAGSAQNVAIDLAVLLVCLFFYQRDEAASQKQLARISREEQLGALRVELSTGKPVKLERLRTHARVVIAAGERAYVEEAAAAAEPFREALLQRGVLFVPVVTEGARLPQYEGAEKRWMAQPLYLPEWTAWLQMQLGVSGVKAGTGVYLSLRLDGRVRASGVGQPPWALLASSLPPVDGVFSGFLDGMDGSVNAEQ
jgi:hypothetical protein